MSAQGKQGKQKETYSGRQQPNYEPSGKGTYNCRWKKQRRKERIAQRLKEKET